MEETPLVEVGWRDSLSTTGDWWRKRQEESIREGCMLPPPRGYCRRREAEKQRSRGSPSSVCCVPREACRVAGPAAMLPREGCRRGAGHGRMPCCMPLVPPRRG